MVDDITTKTNNLNSCEQTTTAHTLVASRFSTGEQIPHIYDPSSYTYTSFTAKVGHTTGTVSQEYCIKRYIANSDLISIHYRESILDFIKTVDNKDN